MATFCYKLLSAARVGRRLDAVSQSCLQDYPDFAERMQRKALRVRSEAHIPPYVTEAESRKQHSDSPLCNSLMRSLYIMCQLCPLISIYISLRGSSSDSLLSRISTWGISNLHVDIFYFPRGGVLIPPKFHLILPKFHFIPPRNFLFSTWGFRNIHVEISFSRHGAVSICSQL